jgi:hypothetical protein
MVHVSSSILLLATIYKENQQSLFEFFGGGADGAAVPGIGHFPEFCLWGARVNRAGMADRDVAVEFSVNEENRDRRGGDGVFGGNLLHVEAVLQARAEKGDFHEGAEDGASDPRAQMKGLSHAVVGDLTKSGEGRLGGYGAEAWMGIERLQELCGSHGFGETEDAAGMIFRLQEVEPLVNVVAFEQAVGGERAAARAVGAGVGKQNGESVGEKELCVSGHSDAVVSEAVKEDNGVSIGAGGADRPGAQYRPVGRGDGRVVQVGVECVSGFADGGDFFFGEWTAGGTEDSVGEIDAADDAESEIQEQREEKVATSTRGAHLG